VYREYTHIVLTDKPWFRILPTRTRILRNAAMPVCLFLCNSRDKIRLLGFTTLHNILDR
jgi:hypothetical protein